MKLTEVIEQPQTLHYYGDIDGHVTHSHNDPTSGINTLVNEQTTLTLIIVVPVK